LLTAVMSSPITVLAVLASVVTLVLTGVLVPKPVVDLLIKSKNEEIDMWKGIAGEREQINRTALEYASKSLGVNETAIKALDSLAAAAQSGDADASATKVP
jgi:hypothetical protein